MERGGGLVGRLRLVLDDRHLLRHRKVGPQAEDPYGLGDVLHALLAEILEAIGDLAPDMVAHAARDADPAGLGQPLDASGDIDAVTEDIAVLHHDIADIDADAEPHLAILAQLLIRQSEVALHLDGALDGGEDAAEFRQHAVAGRVADPAAMLGDQRIGDGAVGRQGRQRRRLVDAHQAAVALDIRRQYGDEFSLEMWCFHVRLVHLSSSISARHPLEPAKGSWPALAAVAKAGGSSPLRPAPNPKNANQWGNTRAGSCFPQFGFAGGPVRSANQSRQAS